MSEKELLEIIDYLEDKDITVNPNWYFHATNSNINTIKKILEEGIKCSYLRGKRNSKYRFNGSYYISLGKLDKDSEEILYWLRKFPKFIIEGINPYFADKNKLKFRRMFINTRIPLRTSERDGEYQQYLLIEPSKIKAIDFSLYNMLEDIKDKNTLKLLKNIAISTHLPIYDIFTEKEINKEKVLKL